MKAILVCGSRNWKAQHSRPIISALFDCEWPNVVIHGAANGADSIAGLESDIRDRHVIRMPAQWERHGRSAGPKRNAEMLRVLLALGECGYSVSVLAFPIGDSRGTRGMIAMAKKAGVDVRVVEGEA